jgi:hypothetical protein
VINFEVWIPTAIWNGRFNGVGNGGLAGTISYSAMAPVVRQGFAAASTDTGHVSTGTQTWLLSRERVIDYSYRGFHLTTQHAKSLIAALYGSGPAYSYYTGCSTGGKQGLMEAQRFPEDYDGIVAGDPANYWTMQMASEVWDGQVTFGSSNLPIAKLPNVNSAVLAACGNNGGGLPPTHSLRTRTAATSIRVCCNAWVRTRRRALRPRKSLLCARSIRDRQTPPRGQTSIPACRAEAKSDGDPRAGSS